MLAIAVTLAPGAGLADESSFQKDVLPVINSQCVMCHLPGAESGELSLLPDPWASLVGIASRQSSLKLIEPGAPDKSYMYLKLTNAQDSVGGSGLQMPPTHRLEDTQIEAICRWIEQGAKPN
jgi:mono/diheme cytochrome c family protein